MATPDFGISANPISTRGTDYARLITTGTPEFSDLPTALDMTKNDCRAVGTGGAMIDTPISELIESLNQNVVSMILDLSMVENGRMENVTIQSGASTSEAFKSKFVSSKATLLRLNRTSAKVRTTIRF